MKTLLLLMLIMPTISFSQATTQPEYNYMKSGFREIEEKGNDLKRGYSITEMPKYVSGDITIRAYILMRSDSSIGGTILKTNSNATFGSGLNYYAIPAVNLRDKESYGWRSFYNDIESMTGGQKSAVIAWLTYQFSYEMSMLRSCVTEQKNK